MTSESSSRIDLVVGEAEEEEEDLRMPTSERTNVMVPDVRIALLF